LVLISKSAASKDGAIEEEKEFTFYFILHAYNSCIPSIVHSPYHTFGGYLWRIVVYPRDSANGVSVALECGGPTVVKKLWSISVRHNLILVHPSKWERFLGITDVDSPEQLSRILDSNNNNNNCEKKEYQYPPQDIPPYDLHVTNLHTFSSTDYSLWDDEEEFAPFAILQPGMFTDDNFNLVVKAHVILNDFFNVSATFDESPAPSVVGSDVGNSNSQGGENNNNQGNDNDALEYLDQDNDLVQHLIARKQLIDEILALDQRLLEVNQDVAKKALEKEIRAIGDTLGNKIDQPKDVLQKLMRNNIKNKAIESRKEKKKFTPKKAIASCFSHPSSDSDSHSIPSIPRICVDENL